jgi:hypothetical protein
MLGLLRPNFDESAIRITSRGVAHRFTDAEYLVEGGDAGVQVDAVGAHKQFIKAEVVEGVLRQLA